MKPLEARRNYRGVLNALVRIAREEGAATLYSGLAPNVFRGMSMNMGMMACYDQVCYCHCHCCCFHLPMTIRVDVRSCVLFDVLSAR